MEKEIKERLLEKEEKIIVKECQKQEVIVVTGTNGSGKSTIVCNLAKKLSSKTTAKKILIGVGTVAGVSILAIGGYVVFHKPSEVRNPCQRSFFRADGIPKVAFDKAWKANWQSVIQLVHYGEICNSYKVGESYYTGHSKYAKYRSINPFK